MSLRRVVKGGASSAVAEVVGVETEREREGGVEEAHNRKLGFGMMNWGEANPQKLQLRVGFGAALISSNSWRSLEEVERSSGAKAERSSASDFAM